MCCSSLSFYMCPIRGGGRRGRGGDGGWWRVGWSTHRVIRRGGGGGRGGGGRGWDSTTATSAGPRTTEHSRRTPSRTRCSATACHPSWSGKCSGAPLLHQLCWVCPDRAKKHFPVPCGHHSSGARLRELMRWRAELFIALAHIWTTVPCLLNLCTYRLIGKRLHC